MADGKEPVRFSRQQLARYTDDYSTRLGAGAFGTVYAATIPNGLKVAVKKLHAGVDWRSEAEFVADVVGTIWRARHTNLVRLVGYCFHLDDDTSSNGGSTVRAMVCEYMERGALDAFLVDCRGRDDAGGLRPDFNLLHSLALGVARGIQYLHDGCQKKIVHYDIKPGNVLLDGGLTPKVADFGLAQLMRRGGGDAHAAGVSMQPPGLADKLDVYNFGMLVLEILDLALERGRRRNLVEESRQQWFPRVTWTKYESGNLMDLVVDTTPTGHDNDGRAVVVAPGDDDDLQQRTETVERMCKVAFWCMQRQPDARPPMGVVVKMLEGDMDITPPPNPFTDLVWGYSDVDGNPGNILFDQVTVLLALFGTVQLHW
jgi:hypothetical protein